MTRPSAMMRRTRRMPVAICLIAIAGCAKPARMQLVFQSPDRPGDTVWWTLDDPTQIHGPIVGVEHRLNFNKSRQVILSNRGFRVFFYSGGRLERSSPPLPDKTAPNDIELLRSVLRRHLKNPDAAPVALPPIPRDEINSVIDATDIVALLEDHWPAARVKPILGLNYPQLNDELEHFPHGVSELLEASKAF